ncbi:MAG: DEAD/DEAH box helicase, partial [Bradymonadaceae bacterium]
RQELDKVVAHMTDHNYLFPMGGTLTFGDEAERAYGRRNFMELYAVFSSPQLFTVVTQTGKELGSLEQQFVDQLLEDQSSFLLGGRAWDVSQVDFQRRRIEVVKAPQGKKPSWGGFMPQFLSREICEQMREILRSDTSLPYLHESAAASLQAQREEFESVFATGTDRPVERGAGEIIWWTFAGGRINTTLKYVLRELYGWDVVTDNLKLRIEGEGLLDGGFDEARARLGDSALWDDEVLWNGIVQGLPEYRLSKFQRVLPMWAQREMVGRFLLDVVGGRGVCGG